MGKLFRAIAMARADAASMKSHRVEAQRGKAFAPRFRPERKWILEIVSGILVIAMVSFVWAHWPASTRIAPQQGVFASIDKSKFLLRLPGSDTTGPVYVPELVRAWFVSVGASGVQETQRAASDGSKIPEWIIRAILNGNLVVVEVKEHGSPTAFRGMAEGDADIGITSPEINSDDVAQLMNDFVRFALSQNIVTKASFVPPPGESPELSSNPPAIALRRDSLKPAITENGAKRNISLAPTPSNSAPPPAAAVVPEVATELAKTPPVTAVVLAPEAPSEPTKRPPPVVAVVPEPGSTALPPVASIVASLSPPLTVPTAPPPVVTVTPARPLRIPPVAITSHRVTITDYPLAAIRLQEQGTVVIKYLVQEDGSVGDCTVTTPSGKSLLDAAACAMVQGRWKFKPASQDGKPVAEFLTAEVVFTLAGLPRDEPSPTILESLSTFVTSLLAE